MKTGQRNIGIAIVAFVCALGATIIYATSMTNKSVQPQPVVANVNVNTLPRADSQFTGHVDGIWTPELHLVSRTTVIPKSDTGDIRGWAFDGATRTPFEAAYVSVDHGPFTLVDYGGLRGDVAQVMKCPACANSGFTVHLAAPQLTAGMHTIQLSFVTQGGTQRVDIPPIALRVKN